MEADSTMIPEWVRWLEALAVPGLAALALVWEVWRGRLRREGFDARISAHAYALRRQLREWVKEPWPESPRARIGKAKELTQKDPLDRAEERTLKIVEAASRASSNIATPARRQYVLFYRATLLLNRASTAVPDTSEQEYDTETGTASGTKWPIVLTDGMDHARDHIEECISVLTEAIDEDLQEIDQGIPRPR